MNGHSFNFRDICIHCGNSRAFAEGFGTVCSAPKRRSRQTAGTGVPPLASHRFGPRGICQHCGCSKAAVASFGFVCKGSKQRSESSSWSSGETDSSQTVSLACDRCGKATLRLASAVVEGSACACGGRKWSSWSSSQESNSTGSDSYEDRSDHGQPTPTPAESDRVIYGRLLGLHGKVTVTDIKKLYYVQMSQYHPDKVQHLGPELRELAERKTKEINEAYSWFKNEYKF